MPGVFGASYRNHKGQDLLATHMPSRKIIELANRKPTNDLIVDMRKIPCKISGAALLFLLTFGQVQAAEETREFVILLHGLARTDRSLIRLERSLEGSGFSVVNISYPSRHNLIEELADDVISTAIARCLESDARKIHFVTHSMGGIMVRYYLENNEVERLGRVVMLSPPNRGSEVVDKLHDSPIFKWWNGPAGEQLGTGAGDVPRTLGVPRYEVGIITGDRSINPYLSQLIPGSDDGKVSVENAKLPGMKDFLVVHQTHTFIMNDQNVLQQVTAFINNGVFDREWKAGCPAME